MKRVAPNVIAIARPTPSSALAKGTMPISSDPSTTMSTARATTTPMASTTVIFGSWMENTSPPTSTWVPAGSVFCNAAPSSWRCARSASVKVMEVPTTRMLSFAVRPLAEICPWTYALYGLTTPLTYGRVAMSLRPASIAFWISASWNECPSGIVTTMVDVESAADGKVIRSWSYAIWLGAPGVVKLSFVG